MKKGRRFLVVMILLCLPVLSMVIFFGTNIAKASTSAVALNGGSIYLGYGANMTIGSDAFISGSSGENGGAVYIGDGATLTMTGGTIDSCSATNGGAVYIANGGTFIFEGGTISNCIADLGYAIYIQRGGNIIMTGGSFVNCGEDEGLHIYAEETLVAMYVDDEIKGMALVGETETLNDIVTPLSSEECCGWFLDSKLTEVLDYDASLEELAGNELFINLYTKTATPEKLTFTLDSATDTYNVRDVSYSVTRQEVVIPREYNGKVVGTIYEGTSWATGAFADNHLIWSLYLPGTITRISDYCLYGSYNFDTINLHNNITSIGNYAFYNCEDLITFKIPDSVISVGNYAFTYCDGLTSVDLGSGLTSIGNYVFSYCDGLTNIDLGNSVTSIGTYAFNECISLESIVIPNSVASIGNYTFRNCSSLANIDLGNGVSSIGSNAFYNCDELTSIVIPNSVTNIDGTAFSYCGGLASIVVDSGNLVYDSRDNCNAIIETNSNTLVSGCKSTIIPDSVTSIGDEAFYYCENLTSINFPNCLVSIGEASFRGCSKLTSVIMSDSITSIGEKAFIGCSSMTELKISNNVSYLDSFVFDGCSGLTNIVLPESVTRIGIYAFRNCTGLTNITFSENLTWIESYAFEGCSSLTSLFIPAKTTYIDGAFMECYSLTSIVVDENNPSYDSRENCNAIIRTGSNLLLSGCQNTIIPESVTAIASYAFNGCITLTNLTIPSSVTSIGNRAFQGCTGLKSIEIPDSVTSIGYDSFQECTSLTSIYIPSSVTTMSAGEASRAIFSGCSTDLVIYCGAEEKPSGWGTYWNYRSNNATFTTYWGYTREEYEQAISSSAFAHSKSETSEETTILSLEIGFEIVNDVALNNAGVNYIKPTIYEVERSKSEETSNKNSVVLSDKKEYFIVKEKKD